MVSPSAAMFGLCFYICFIVDKSPLSPTVLVVLATHRELSDNANYCKDNSSLSTFFTVAELRSSDMKYKNLYKTRLSRR